MTLKQQIENDIKEAMKAKNHAELLALRSIKSMILLAETEKGATGEIADEVVNKILMKAAKQREESATLYKDQNRNDLAAKELEELEIIKRYLPEQLSEEAIEAKVQEIIDQVGATSMADMGKVMAAAMKALGGAADGKAISTAVKKQLS
jgi:hypothetical protein